MFEEGIGRFYGSRGLRTGCHIEALVWYRWDIGRKDWRTNSTSRTPAPFLAFKAWNPITWTVNSPINGHMGRCLPYTSFFSFFGIYNFFTPPTLSTFLIESSPHALQSGLLPFIVVCAIATTIVLILFVVDIHHHHSWCLKIRHHTVDPVGVFSTFLSHPHSLFSECQNITCYEYTQFSFLLSISLLASYGPASWLT